MSNDSRIIELLAELVKSVDQLGANQRETNERLGSVDVRLESMDKRLDRLEQRQAKTNIILQDHSLALMKLADKMDEFVDHGKRLLRLEEAVFH